MTDCFTSDSKCTASKGIWYGQDFSDTSDDLLCAMTVRFTKNKSF